MTAREHILCHILLAVINPTVGKLQVAADMMINVERGGIVSKMRNTKLAAELKEKAALYKSESQKGREFTEEWKKKISEAKIGKPRSEETKRKLSEIFTGREISEEWRQKISKGLKGFKHDPESVKRMVETRKSNGSYKVSDETRKKQSEAKKGKPSAISKKVVNVITGETYRSVAECSRLTGISKKVMHSRLKKGDAVYKYA